MEGTVLYAPWNLEKKSELALYWLAVKAVIRAPTTLVIRQHCMQKENSKMCSFIKKMY